MSRTEILRDRLELLIELEAIEEGLAAVERRYWLHELIEGLRQRQQRGRVTVTAQIRGLLNSETIRVH